MPQNSRKRPITRLSAAGVLFAFLFSQNAWALDLSAAINAVLPQNTEEAERPAGGSAASFQAAEAQKLDLLAQKQAVEFLSATQNIGAFQVIPAIETPAPIDAAVTPVPADGDFSDADASSDIEDSLDEDFDYVQFFENASIAGTFSPTNDPYYSDLAWLQQVNADDAWELTRGAGITVAVLDTGIDLNHPDLAGNIWANLAELNGQAGVDDDGNGFIDDIRGWDFISNDNLADDQNGHGTHVAGIIGALRNNGTGVAGMAPEAKIIPIQVLDASGGGYWPDVLNSIINGIKYAADLGADVINLSLGIPYDLFTATQKADFISAVDYARALGSIVVTAAGNETSNIDTVYPASFTNVLTVGSVSPSNTVSAFSNFGNGLDLVAPGENVLSAYYDNAYAYGTGTSMSTAVVSGAVALALSLNPLMSFDDLVRIFTYSSLDRGDLGYDSYYGYGVLDARKAVSEDYFSGGYLMLRRYADGHVDYYYNDNFYGDKTGRLYKTVLPDGSYKIIEAYWTDSDVVKIERHYTSADALIKTVEFYSSGNEKSLSNADGSGYTRLDEDFFGDKTGRLSRSTQAGGAYTTFESYYPSTTIARFQKDYSSTGVLLETREYDSSGNLIPPPSGGDPVLAFSINAQGYSSASGSVLNYSGGVLAMYGNRSINYALNLAEGSDYSLKFSTAQITSKNAPAGYLFHFNIKIDGVTVATADLNSSKTFVASDYIDLGSLSPGAHTLTLQWTNDSAPTGYDSNLGIKDLEVYKDSGASPPPALPCDAVSCLHDAQDRIIRSNYSDGTYALHEYILASTQRSKSTHYTSGGALIKIVSFYSDGNELGQSFPNGSGYERYDEDFFDDKTGRLWKTVFADLSYEIYEEYWPGTATVKIKRIYATNGTLIAINHYDSNGNLISPPDGDPILTHSINTQDYSSVSGSVLHHSNGALGMYGNRSITYSLDLAEETGYSLKISTAQITSKTVPAGYLFHLNFFVNGVLKASADLSSSKTYTESDFIDLGNLLQGSSTLTIQWTNDTNAAPHDSNLGIKDIKVYKAYSALICDAVSCEYDSQSRITRSVFSDGSYADHQYYGDSTQRSVSRYHGPPPAGLVKTVEFYVSGNEKSEILPNGSGVLRLDEDFYGNKKGRLSRTILPDLSYKSYDEYWPGTATVKVEKVYNAEGALLETNNYDPGGNLVPSPASTPVLAYSINAHDYSSASGSMLLNSNGVLGMYGNRTINYAVNIAEGAAYSLKFQTAQITSKSAPPGYLFHFNILVDGVVKAVVDLNSSKTFTLSDYINLGNLGAGAHTLTIQWTNDTNASPYDANLGIKNIEVYKIAASVTLADYSTSYINPSTSSTSYIQVTDTKRVYWGHHFSPAITNAFAYYDGTSVNTVYDDEFGNISYRASENGNFVWISTRDGSYNRLFLYNGSEVIELTYPDFNNVSSVSINAFGDVIWSMGDSADSEIFLYKQSTGTVTRLTNNNFIEDTDPQINDAGIVVWKAGGNLYRYDGSTTTNLTPGSHYVSTFQLSAAGEIVFTGRAVGDPSFVMDVFKYTAAGFSRITNDSANDFSPFIAANGSIAWFSSEGGPTRLFYNNGTVTTLLSDAVTNKSTETGSIISDNGWVVWREGINSIILFDGSQSRNLSVSGFSAITTPVISPDGIVAWAARDSANKIHIFLSSPN